jgi:hypothetical protein
VISPEDRKAARRAELLEHLSEQLQFLAASADAFDRGFEGEGKRLATVIRVLVNDTKYSTSLVQQIGVKDDLQFADTAPNLPPVPASTPGHAVFMGMTSLLAPPTLGSGAPAYTAVLGDGWDGSRKPFDGWWNAVVMVDSRGNEFSRRRTVLALANQDGGAHIDPKLDAGYEAISRQRSMGWFGYKTAAGEDVVVDVNPALGTVRQIAFEVQETLAVLLD